MNERRGTYRPPSKRKRHNPKGDGHRDFHGQNSGGGQYHRGPGQNQRKNRPHHRQDYDRRYYPSGNRDQENSNGLYIPPDEQNGRNGMKPRNNRSQTGRLPDGSFDVFELFCAYHLGITPDGQYRQQNIHDLARRFNCTPAELKQALVDNRIDSQTLINSDFDLSMAQLDIMVAPEGVDKRELARPWFDEFMKSHQNARDWRKELERDAEENAKIFGDKD